MKIGVLGVGRCGLPIALQFEQKGFDVIASSYKKLYVEKLQNKICDTTEPKVKDLLIKSKITFTTDNQQLIDQSDVIYIIVATDSLDSGEYDMSAIESIVDDFFQYKKSLKNKLCMIASTTNPGYCETVAQRLKQLDLNLVYCPIIVAQGSIFDDFEKQDHIMIGCDNELAFNTAKNMFLEIIDDKEKIVKMSFTSTELAKMALNCYSTLKIAWINMMGEILHKSGNFQDKQEFFRLLGMNSRIGKKSSNFGFGYGGPCLPRDNLSFVRYAEKIGFDYSLGLTIDSINQKQTKFLYRLYEEKNIDNLPYYFSYISYKPGTDIDEPSQQYELAKMFLQQGKTVFVSPSEFLNTDVFDRLHNEFPSLIHLKTQIELENTNTSVYVIN